MSTGDPARAAPGDYVVRHGWRGFLGAALGLVAWTALSVVGWKSHVAHLGSRAVLVAAAVEVAFLVACATKLRQAVQRNLILAVRPDGIFFGPDAGPGQQYVPWSQISAVELFRERVSNARSRSSYRCIGLRTSGTQ